VLAASNGISTRLQPRSVDLVCFPEMAFTGKTLMRFPSVPHVDRSTKDTSLKAALPSNLTWRRLAQDQHRYSVQNWPNVYNAMLLLDTLRLCLKTNCAIVPTTRGTFGSSWVRTALLFMTLLENGSVATGRRIFSGRIYPGPKQVDSIYTIL
jgi:hypothetical protein